MIASRRIPDQPVPRTSAPAPTVLPLVTLALVALALVLTFATPAIAAPPCPTMDLAELRAALETGPLDGHLKTAMRGYAVEDIPLQVHGLVDYAWGTLILIEASGPQIDRIGGIAQGMSGSPVYVDDGGTMKLIGAVSYGDWFTIGGMGLATPIEYMTAVEDAFPLAPLTVPAPPAPGTYELDEPVTSSEGGVSTVVVARSAAAAAKVAAAPGQSVMAPLGLIEIGGLRPQSDAYKRLAAKLAKTGMSVVPASGSGRWSGPPAPDLEPGSPCATLFSRGAVWFGATGTVTYVNGDTVLAFGHPLWWAGDTDGIFAAAFVEGVWPNQMAPYKLASPRDTKGALLQDRYWGVAARLSREPDLFPVTTTVDLTDRGSTHRDESEVSQWLATLEEFAEAPAYVVAEALLTATDQYNYPGSAETTTSVTVSDATGTYTIERDNVWDDGYDVSWVAAQDLAETMWSLAENPDGVLRVRVDSVDVEASLTRQRRSARVAGVVLPGGLRTGDNTVYIDYYRWGSATPQRLETTLTIPPRTAVNGWLTVMPAVWDAWDSGFPEGEDGGAPPETLAELVERLSTAPGNGDLLMSFEPQSRRDDGDGEPETIDVIVPAGFVFDDYFSQPTARVVMSARPRTVAYGGSAGVSGFVMTGSDVGVNIFRRDAGSDVEVFVKKVTARADGGGAEFNTFVSGLKRTTTIIARTDATATTLPGSASGKVNVRADVRLRADRAGNLTVRVRPGDASGKARVQRKIGGRWVTMRTVTVTDGSGTTRLRSGTYVLRARFSGSTICAPGVSPVLRVTVR